MADRNRGGIKPPGIKDVAAAAGVSFKTVSNVVNSTGRVGEATRTRVLAAIEQLGYRPNLAGRQLRQGRTRTIALALPSIGFAYFAQLAQSVVDVARSRGYAVFIEITRADEQTELSVARGFDVLGIDGIIFSPLALTLGCVDEQSSSLPTVLLGERGQAKGLELARCDHVGIDNVAAAREATRHLIRTGRTRLAFLGDEPQADGSGAPRLAGFRAELAEAGCELDERWILAPQGYSREAGAASIAAVLARIGQIDAIVCASDELAIGAMHELRRNGVRVPQDIAVLGWDNVEDGRYSCPSLTTVAPDTEEIASVAVERVIARIEGGVSEPVASLVPHRLLVRESTAPA